MEVHKSSETEEQYRNIAERLLGRFAADGDGRTWHMAPLEVASWLERSAREKGWARRTLGLYRASLAWFMRQNGPIEAVIAIKNVRPVLTSRGAPMTSGKKVKKLPPEKLSRLLTELEISSNPLDHTIENWLRAGLASGMRPCEWEQAQLLGLKLHIKNAKGNAFRANGEKRILEFVLPEHKNEIKFIRRFLTDLETWEKTGKTFNALYAACRKRLYYINRRFWPRSLQNICLYSTRHQFAADMKASGLSKAEIAALMGHASDESATIHYARKRSGHVRTPPLISPNQIATVRRTMHKHPSTQS